MAPRWPQVNVGPENINEHATYPREASHQLQAADRGRTNQIPWNVVQPYIASNIALISKVLQQPSMSEVLQQIQDAAKDIEVIRRESSIFLLFLVQLIPAVNCCNGRLWSTNAY